MLEINVVNCISEGGRGLARDDLLAGKIYRNRGKGDKGGGKRGEVESRHKP